MKVNIKNIKACAFCKYWYDPTNANIKPVAPNINLWECKNNIKCKCLKRNVDTLSTAHCIKYECKEPIM